MALTSDLLLELGQSLISVQCRKQLYEFMDSQLKELAGLRIVSIGLPNEGKATWSNWFQYSSLEDRSGDYFHPVNAAATYIREGLFNVTYNGEEPLVWKLGSLPAVELTKVILPSYVGSGLDYMVSVPLAVKANKLGCLFLLFDEEGDWLYAAAALKGVTILAGLLAATIANILGSEKKDDVVFREEQLSLQQHTEMVGSGSAIHRVLAQVSQVAPSPATVLIIGETGTGKELVARAIHALSGRRDKLMIKVNCAAIPSNLIESELFGHEKGSFTGATERRIGKFELAHNGTIFLDEIGELPLELQSKLLRVLQEREIERVGGRTMIKTDVRIIAATNRDLHKEVLAGRFRSDLFYRLYVFPISIPPLRDRKEDIPELAGYFLQKHARKGNKTVKSISPKLMKQLMNYAWPGNVRELEHLIERSILLTTGGTIDHLYLHFSKLVEPSLSAAGKEIKTIDEVEREHILFVLKLCDGKISGPGGAAEKLRIAATTLSSKIKRLGITRSFNEK